MDNLTLAQKLLGKEKTIEDKSEHIDPSSASIVYMIAVTASSGGEVVLKNEIDSSAEWEEGDFIEIDEDGDFEEYESDDDPLEDVDDSVVDMTDGDGANIEDTDAEAVSFSVSDYHETAVAALAEETEAEAVEDELPDEETTIDDTIDDGDTEVIPDVGELDEDDLPDENTAIDDIDDSEYTLTDDNSDDESDEPIEGAEVSDGYTVADCIGSINEGDRVAVMIQNGRMIVLGVVGAGDEQEALRRQAQEAADEASEAAADAQEKAEQVHDLAEGAAQDAADAKAQADAANQAATNAQNAANQATTEAQEATQKALDAAAKADAVEENMAEVSAEVDTVKEDAVKMRADLEGEIETVKTTMSQTYATKNDVSTSETTLRKEISDSIAGIQTTFAQDYAKKTELSDAIVDAKASLQTQITQNANQISLTAKSIEDIQVDITDQNGKIANAIKTAEDAQGVADAAKTDAQEAQAAANKAQSDATAANTAAINAQNEANNAKTQAEAAQSLADAAKKDLATAEAKLAEVESNGQANAEDIAQAQQAVQDAQAAVNAAQAAADKAKQDAATAQSTADTAKSDAAKANTAAGNAQTKANEAKTAADNAQKAADEAKEELDALKDRVVECETAIEQNSEAILLRATKIEMVKAIDDISVGGRNLIPFSKIAYHNTTLLEGTTTKYLKLSSSGQYDGISIPAELLEVSSYYVLQYDLTLLSGVGSVGSHSGFTEVADMYVDGVKTGAYSNAITLEQNKKVHVTVFIKTASSIGPYGTPNIFVQAQRKTDSPITMQYVVENLKIEKGNKATDWTPAPEDQDAATQAVANNLANNYYTKTQTDAQIQVKADSILSTVLTTYQTKDAMGNYSTTAQMNSAIEQKASSITSTVASTYLSKTDANTTYATKTEVTQTASGLEVKITSAQNTADTAKSNAATAQTTANTAKTNAATAQTTANNAAKTATNFMSYDATNGLLIGNKTSGSWSGSRAQILPTAFNILASDGKKLASYQAAQIDLGMNSDATVINLCDGTGYIRSFSEAVGTEWQRLLLGANHSIGFNTSCEITADTYYEDSSKGQSHSGILRLMSAQPWDADAMLYPYCSFKSMFTNGDNTIDCGLELNHEAAILSASGNKNVKIGLYPDGSGDYDHTIAHDGCIMIDSDRVCATGHICNGYKSGHLDGKQGIFMSNEGYIQLQRDSSAGYHPYISFHIGTTTGTDGQIRLNQGTGYMEFKLADRYTFDNRVDVVSLYADQGIRIGEDGNVTASRVIGTYWKDNAVHYIVERSSDGLTSAFGWAGSSSYATISKIRGRTCQVQNASGTSALSDERLKKDFTELDAWDAFYDALEPCAFRLKTGNSGRYHMGFKAQQVEQALLDAGLTTNDFAGFIKMPYLPDEDDPEGNAVYAEAGINAGDDEYGLIYSEFTALNTWKIQKMQKRIDELEKLVEQLLPI